MRPALIQEYFGMRNFGTVIGLIIGINMTGSIVGPALAGWAFDAWGSYKDIWIIMATLPAAAVFATLIMVPVRSSQR